MSNDLREEVLEAMRPRMYNPELAEELLDVALDKMDEIADREGDRHASPGSAYRTSEYDPGYRHPGWQLRGEDE